jgi:hypothetical protein
MRVLKRGFSGDDVERWQQFLVGQGQQLEVDSGFGKDTYEATRNFQRDNHLEVDGKVGHNTLGRAMLLGFDPLEDPDNDAETGPNWPPRPSFNALVSTAQRQQMFGAFQFQAAPLPNNRENIRISGGWEQQNIVRVPIPQLVGVQGASHDGGVRFHRSAANQLRALWQAWADADLIDRVLTWEGSFVPRFVRGSSSVLSNHAFGTAFDINAGWNARGAQPALKGKKGCVRELVPLAHQHGFYWGGHFGNKLDGMHFEVAVIQP